MRMAPWKISVKNMAESNNALIRREKKQWRNDLSRDRVQRDYLKICSLIRQIFASATYPGVILTYAALGNEADLSPFIRELLYQNTSAADQKMSVPQIFYPRTRGEQMDFIRVDDPDKDLKEGSFHIMEPVGSELFSMDQTLHTEETVICFVPGVVFDTAGNRLGFGRGYYDRFLKSYPDMIRIGICYEGQLSDRIEPAHWDQGMDLVITEERIYVCSEKGQKILKKDVKQKI